MLGKKSIVAFSPELGINNKQSDSFYPDAGFLVNSILPSNLRPALYGIVKTGVLLKGESISNWIAKCSLVNQFNNYHIKSKYNTLAEENCIKEDYYQIAINIKILNSGLSNMNSIKKLLVQFDNQLAETIYIKAIKNENEDILITNEMNITNSNNYFNQTINVSNLQFNSSEIIQIYFYLQENQIAQVKNKHIIISDDTIQPNESFDYLQELHSINLTLNLQEFKNITNIEEYENSFKKVFPSSKTNVNFRSKMIVIFVVIGILLGSLIAAYLYFNRKKYNVFVEEENIAPSNTHGGN